MATPKKNIAKPKKKLFRFYGFYDNFAIGPRVHLNGVKIILHEELAMTLDEALEQYKIHLIKKVGISEANIEKYLIDVYYKSIKVEIIDVDSTEHTEVGLVA